MKVPRFHRGTLMECIWMGEGRLGSTGLFVCRLTLQVPIDEATTGLYCASRLESVR